MENDQDIHKIGSQFSTLNVNAVEFVPSFCVSSTKDIPNEDPPPAPRPVIETPENNGNGKKLFVSLCNAHSIIKKKKLPHQKSVRRKTVKSEK
jgi:Ataxin-2 C-terminal region